MTAWWRGSGEMPSLEERVAYLEGRFGDHAGAVDDLRSGLSETRTDLRTGLARVDVNLTEVRSEMNRRFEAVEARFAALDGKIDRHFTWLVGIQVAVLVAVVGALVGSYYR